MEVLSEFANILASKIAIISVLYVLVLFLIFSDLFSGIRKAKLKGDYSGFFRPRKKNKDKVEGEYISSYGLQKTVNKIARYYNMLFAVTAIDMMQMLGVFYMRYKESITFIPILPLFTFLAALFIGVIEIKSIYENAEQKEKAKAAQAARFIGEALKDTDTLRIVQNVLKQKDNEEKNS